MKYNPPKYDTDFISPQEIAEWFGHGGVDKFQTGTTVYPSPNPLVTPKIVIPPNTPTVNPEDVKVRPAEIKNAVKFDSGKVEMHLLPTDAIEEITKVLMFGANKYAPNNWKANGGFSYSRVFNSTIRHMFAWWRGEDKDPESGLSHLAHAGCCILFLLHYVLNKEKYGKDDRV